jgi:hypothetical protein
MVEQGEVKVATAQTVSKLPKADQKKAAAAGPEGVRKAARKNGGRKKQPRREATIPATEEEAVANVGAIDDLLAKWESMPGFRKMLAQWEDRKRWTFCDKIESLSRTLRKLATDLRHPKG